MASDLNIVLRRCHFYRYSARDAALKMQIVSLYNNIVYIVISVHLISENYNLYLMKNKTNDELLSIIAIGMGKAG